MSNINGTRSTEMKSPLPSDPIIIVDPAVLEFFEAHTGRNLGDNHAEEQINLTPDSHGY